MQQKVEKERRGRIRIWCRVVCEDSQLEKRMEEVERAMKKTRARPNTRKARDGKRKSNRYDRTIAGADGRGSTRFGRRFELGENGKSTGDGRVSDRHREMRSGQVRPGTVVSCLERRRGRG